MTGSAAPIDLSAGVGLRRPRVGGLTGSGAPIDLSAGVSLRSTIEAAMATGDAAALAAIQPAAASSTTLLTMSGRAVHVLLAVLAGAPTADGPAGVLARALAGVLADTRTTARLVAAR